MGRRVVYTCDYCGSAIDLDKQVGILDYCSARNSVDESWALNRRKYICNRCLEKISLIMSK
nr:MAG TPA: 50S ribosomal subunit [Crassvirales sp.]DAO31197.1 MAG TPA: 50S ribosomal subunit [Crassvirales sp.]